MAAVISTRLEMLECLLQKSADVRLHAKVRACVCAFVCVFVCSCVCVCVLCAVMKLDSDCLCAFIIFCV